MPHIKFKKHTQKEREEALDAIKKGMSVLEVSKLTGITDSLLYRWIHSKADFQPAQIPQCPICGKQFSTPQALGPHKRVHTVIPKKTPPIAIVQPTAEPTELLKREDLIEIVQQTVIRELDKKVVQPTSPKMTVDEFIQLLRELISDNTQMHEELARQRKLKDEWQKRAGQALEQAQQAIREMNR
jgi:hypothetical protein